MENLKEELLFQGAIDLLALCEDGTARIIDYKYSRKGAEGLKKRYEKQLALYKNVVAKILKLDKDYVEEVIKEYKDEKNN